MKNNSKAYFWGRFKAKEKNDLKKHVHEYQ